MNIFLLRLVLTNFKRVRHLVIDFNQVTDLFGDNGTGKTTIFDAFLWLLFGKDSSDRKDYEIKTLDENNQPYHRLDHEVAAVLLINGEEVSIKRSYRENWSTKRGTTQEEFTGHTTEFFWNDVPMKKADFEAKVSSLINENIFKLITNTNYFASLKWQERRNVLIAMAGEVNDTDVLSSIHGDLSELKKAFAQGKTIEEFKAQISTKKKKIKDEKEKMPARIDEANRSLPDEMDYDALEQKLAAATAEITQLDKMIADKNEAQKVHQEAINGLIKQKGELDRQLMEIDSNVRTTVKKGSLDRAARISELTTQFNNKQVEVNNARVEYSEQVAKRDKLKQEVETIRNNWTKENATTLAFNEDDFCCPTCKRAFEAADIEDAKAKLTKNFNTSKSKKLQEIHDEGSALNVKIADLETVISNLSSKGVALKAEAELLDKQLKEAKEENERLSADETNQIVQALANNADFARVGEEIKALTEKINSPSQVQENSALVYRKAQFVKESDDIKASLGNKEMRTKQLARIEELKNSEKQMAQELSQLEGIEFSIEEFTKAKMDAIEQSINSKFSMVKFKMFEDQINGGQAECCEILINGVPFNAANTASRINAGLDIINALCNHYGVKAPVFIDNRESVVKIINSESQIINLWVSEKDKKLRIGKAEKQSVAA